MLAKRSQLLRFLLVVVVVCLVATTWLGRGSDSKKESLGPPEGAVGVDLPLAEATAAPPEASGGTGLISENRVTGGAGDRVLADARPFELRVLVAAVGGEAIIGAVVSWTVIPSESSHANEEGDRILALLEGSSWAETDSSGVALFRSRPVGAEAQGSILWATHADYLAAAVALDSTGSKLTQEVSLNLQPAAPLMAYASAETVGSIPGTRLLQSGLDVVRLRSMDRDNSWFRGGPGRDPLAEDLARSFVREYVCDDEGNARIMRGAMPTRLEAVSGDLCSGPVVTDPHDQSIQLVMAGSLVVGGSVRGPGVDPPPVEARIECRWKAELSEQVFGEFAVESNGSWGPVNLPARASGAYIFRLLGGEYVPEERTVEARGAVSPLHVDFDGVLGKAQRVLVVDQDDRPVANARVEAIWQAGDLWQRSRAWTGPEGRALLHGCPRATAWMRIHKTDYVEFNESSVFLVQPHELTFALEPAGQVLGRVTHLGKPVREFQVFTWVGSPFDRIVHSFSDREDGRFELDSVAFGKLSLLASSPEFPAGEAVTIEILGGSPVGVEFELPSGVVGVGRVIDAVTGEPLSGATVEVVTMFSGRPLGGRGKQVSTGSNGRFEVTGVQAGHAWINVSAPGRVMASSGGKVGLDARVDFGTVLLAVRQTLAVTVDSPRPLKSREVWFGSSGSFGIPLVHMPPGGEITVPDVAPGRHAALLVFDDGGFISQPLVLRSGVDWEVRFDYMPDKYIDVLIVPDEDRPLTPDTDLHAEFLSSSGVLVTRTVAAAAAGDVTRINHIPAGDVLLSVSDGAWENRLGSQRIQVSADRSEVVEFRMGTRRIEVTGVDSNGDRIDQGVVVLDSTVPGDLFNNAASLPPVGPFTYDAIPVDELLVTVRHSTLGMGFELVEMAPDGVTSVEVQVGGTPMNIRVTDGGMGVAGVDVRLIPQFVTTHGFGGTTNDDGRWTYLGIPPRHYSILLKRYGYWPERHEVDFNGQELLSLGIRECGDLTLLVTNAEGTPVQGQAVALWSVADGVSVPAWTEQGLLPASAVNLLSDGQGACRVAGVPNGPYRWEVVLADGTVQSGECTVPRGAEGSARITLEQ